MHKLKQIMMALKWQRQVRAALSTQLSLLENPTLFALGGLTDEEERGLTMFVRTHASAFAKDGPIVEFGTLFGITTLLLAQVKPAGVKVITVDNFCWNPFGLPAALHRDFTQRILRIAICSGDVELAATSSQAFRESYQGAAPRMVFLDADHSYEAVRDEIAWAKALGVPLICGHDYGNARFGVTRAVDEAFPDGVDVCGMVWAKRR